MLVLMHSNAPPPPYRGKVGISWGLDLKLLSYLGDLDGSNPHIAPILYRGLDQITCPKVRGLDHVIGLLPTYPRRGEVGHQIDECIKSSGYEYCMGAQAFRQHKIAPQFQQEVATKITFFPVQATPFTGRKSCFFKPYVRLGGFPNMLRSHMQRIQEVQLKGALFQCMKHKNCPNHGHVIACSATRLFYRPALTNFKELAVYLPVQQFFQRKRQEQSFAVS